MQHGQKQKIENARKALDEGPLFTVDNYSGTKEGDIEDVLGRDFYVALVNKAYRLSSTLEVLSTDKLASSERVAKDVEAAFAVMPAWVREFDHFVPAEYLFQHGDEGITYKGFKGALARMERLIEDLNSRLR